MTNEELAERIKAGEKDLIIELWQQVRKLVIKIMSSRYLPRDGSTNKVGLEDLLQAGFIGVMSAVSDFDPTSGFAFTTYLNSHLKNAANEALGTRSNKQKQDPIFKSISLDKPLRQEEDFTLGDVLEDQSSRYIYDDLIDTLDQEEIVSAIFKQMDSLDQMERDVFSLRYLESMTLKAISERLGIKTDKANRILSSALRKLRYSKTIRLMPKERIVDRNTNFYKKKSISGFNTSFSSAVEDIVIRRETLRKTEETQNGQSRQKYI